MTSVPLFGRTRVTKPKDIPTDVTHIEESIDRANVALGFLASRRSAVESLVRAVGDMRQYDPFGDEIMQAFTPRRSPNAPGPRLR